MIFWSEKPIPLPPLENIEISERRSLNKNADEPEIQSPSAFSKLPQTDSNRRHDG